MKRAVWMVAVLVMLASSIYISAEPSEEAEIQAGKMEMMHGFISIMNEYLEVHAQWAELLDDAERSAIMVAERVVEVYEHKGDKSKSVPALEKMLQEVDSTRVKRAFLFKIAEIHKEAGNDKEAIAALEKILKTK